MPALEGPRAGLSPYVALACRPALAKPRLRRWRGCAAFGLAAVAAPTARQPTFPLLRAAKEGFSPLRGLRPSPSARLQCGLSRRIRGDDGNHAWFPHSTGRAWARRYFRASVLSRTLALARVLSVPSLENSTCGSLLHATASLCSAHRVAGTYGSPPAAAHLPCATKSWSELAIPIARENHASITSL